MAGCSCKEINGGIAVVAIEATQDVPWDALKKSVLASIVRPLLHGLSIGVGVWVSRSVTPLRVFFCCF